jgi:type I restriction enzyme S subunit
MSKQIRIEDIVDSISITHKFPNPEVVFLNTSDIFEGKILNTKYSMVKNLKGQAKKTICNGDILFSEIRPRNKRYAFVNVEKPEDYVVSTKLMVLRNKNKEVLNEYFYYFLTYDGTLEYLQMRAENRIGSFPQITFDVLKPIILNIPDFDEQSKIIRLISTIDNLITLNNKSNSELESLAKTIYYYWFVQFDFPDKRGKPYKSSGGKMVWSDKLKNEIPEGWEVKKISDLIAEDKSGDWGKDVKDGSYCKEVFCIRGADINGLNGKENCQPPKRYILEKNNNKFLNPHDLIVEISGGSPIQSTGRIAYISSATFRRFASPLICSNFCKAISLKEFKLTYYFHMYWNVLYANNAFFRYEGKTTGIKNLLFDIFINTNYILIPNDIYRDKYFDIMEKLEEKRQVSLDENQKLMELRDWLLPMLMNGQVQI